MGLTRFDILNLIIWTKNSTEARGFKKLLFYITHPVPTKKNILKLKKVFETISVCQCKRTISGKGYDIAPEHLKNIGKMKKDLSTIFKDDAGAPTDFNVFLNL